MARIRTIKPEFWTDEKVVELSAFARLLFIGIWNFVDDEGRMAFSPKRLKMQVFPSDDVDCASLIDELLRQGLVLVYEVNGARYMQVYGFAKHQKIDKRSASKHPAPPHSADYHHFPPDRGQAVTTTVGVDATGAATITVPRRISKPCPHQEIIALYHEILPMCPPVRSWTSARQNNLRARWNEDEARQDIDYWRRFFEYVKTCRFLVGQDHDAKRRPFFADLEWLTKLANFTKVREERYAN